MVKPDAETARALAGIRFLRTFDGTEPSPGILAAIRERRTSGVVIFRARNVESPAQVRELSRHLQAARPAGDPPLVIGLDQEGGQLQAVGDGATAWPGNLALGATRSPELALRAGRALGLEAAAMGATLVFAPVCDLLYPASATPLGTRPFGSEPGLVGPMTAALVAGIQESGVAASLKHFPGHGAAQGDSHVAMPVVGRSRRELERDLRPFEVGIAAGAAAVLVGHLAVPALTAGIPVAATTSPAILGELLRAELGFRGITISDAMDMGGAGGPGRLFETVIAAADAGMDLLLMAHSQEIEDGAFEALAAAVWAGLLDPLRLRQAEVRILAARRSTARAIDDQPAIEVVDGPAHRALADEIARASMTLVRDPVPSLPLREGAAGRVQLIAPVPVDLTPAETSSYVRLGLADALRERGVDVDTLVSPLDPDAESVAQLMAKTADYDVVLVATFDAVSFPGQARLVRAVAAATAGHGTCIAIALRTPYDAALYPESIAAVCTYGIQAPQMAALADALLGRIAFAGALPVELPAGADVPAAWWTGP